jgi:hypothetical protein|nr:MAG TPA: ERF superfamily protein [Bacteriophage sp.]
METVENMDIYSKLLKCQLMLKAPKGQYNSFGKYKYRNCEDILEALKPVLNEYGCTVVITDQIISLEGRFYVQATVKFIDVESGNIIYTTGLAREPESKTGMDTSQITGASSSYARKYALNGMFAIDDTKDADSMDNTKKSNKKITKGQAQEIIKALQGKYGENAVSELNKLGYKATSDIPSDKFDEVMSKIK